MAKFQTQLYGGASYWAAVPVIRLVLHADDLNERSTDVIAGICEKLAAALPGMSDHPCSASGNGHDGCGLFERVRTGVNFPHLIQHAAVELQNLAGQRLGLGRTHVAPSHGDFAPSSASRDVIYPYKELEVGIAAGKLAIRLLEFFLQPDRNLEFNFASEREELFRLAERLRYGPTTRALVAEAARRDIPVHHLDDRRTLVKLGSRSRASRSLLQLGFGKYQQRIWASLTSKGSHIAAQIASNKELTNRLLSHAGLPVPRMVLAIDDVAAVDAAREIGYPVVLKPLDSHHGAGVGVDLRDESEVRAHFPVALRATLSGTVLVESFIPGRTYRILVVGGHVVAVSEEAPAQVVGDGLHTLAQLVELTNADPKRGLSAENFLVRIQFDEAAIALAQKQGCGPDDVPPVGQRVRLVVAAHISLGGTSIDCSDEIHPYNAAIAEQAALAVGLEVAGVDLIAPDIAQSVRETGGAICEVNAGPGLGLHTEPIEGQSRDVARPIIEFLFPPGVASRVPIVAVTGTTATSITSRMVAYILKIAGRSVGLATIDGMYIDGMSIIQRDSSGPDGARMVLRNPAIDAAVLEIGYQGILRSGLGYDRADVAVITNVSGEQADLPGIATLQDLARLNAVVAKSVGRCGVTVLNADDEWCVQIAGEIRGQIIFFSLHADHPVLKNHRRAQGRAVVLRRVPEGEGLCLIDRDETRLLLGQKIPVLVESGAQDYVAGALAAAAACVGLGIDVECIRQGLRAFPVPRVCK